MEKGHTISVLDKGYVKLIDYLGDDNLPLLAARMSTDNPTGVDEKKDDNLRDYLWRHNHASPFEFGYLIIEVKLPIMVAREWMRHRTLHYNEYSQRYSPALDDYYVPPMDRLVPQDSVNKQNSLVSEPVSGAPFIFANMVVEQCKHRANYNTYLEAGLAREIARVNMPVSNYTKFMVGGDLRNWYNFINLRIRPDAQLEIRKYAEAVYEIIKTLWPKTSVVFEENVLHAEKFSKSEMDILRDLIQVCDIGLIDDCQLSKSRIKEFKKKLGLE